MLPRERDDRSQQARPQDPQIVKVLWLKSDLLFPLDKGGKLRTWHLMRHLAARHEITYVAFASRDESPENVRRMREVATRVECIPRFDPPKRSLRFYLDAAIHLADPLPYAIGKYRSRAYRNRVRELLAREPFDVIVCDFVLPAVNLPRTVPCPVVIFTHNVESEIWRRHAETQTGRLGRFAYAMQHRRMLRFEEGALARADGVLAVSDVDRDTLARLYPEAIREPVFVVPTGVDTEFFQPVPEAARPRSLVFTGSMDWLPNEDAMLFFCREVLPLIRADEPEVTLSIVGRTPTSKVERLAQDHGVAVTGRVDDVRPHIAEAAVYVVPLRIGGGTRLKIFEAMAMGKAVVSTAVGAEGLPVQDGRDLVLADGPRAFADAVVGLLRDGGRRRALETAARALVLERYDWSAVAGELESALIRSVAARRGQPTPRGSSERLPLPSSAAAHQPGGQA